MNIPQQEVIDAADLVGRWLAERNIEDWEIGPCASRKALERLRAESADMRAEVFTNGDRKMTMEGRTFTVEYGAAIYDNNFDFDAGMSVSGDFVDDEKRQYAEMIAGALNSVSGALPDDTALHARLAAERERCARLIEFGRFLHDESPDAQLAREAAKSIRAFGDAE